MKITVVGLGAVGGLIAARLALAGHDVSAVARGAVLAAVRARGLRLHIGGEEHVARIQASDDAHALGPRDLVVVALKAPALREAAQAMQPLLGAHTHVMPAMNGVPWWFLQAPPIGAHLPASNRRRCPISDRRFGLALSVESLNSSPPIPMPVRSTNDTEYCADAS